MLAHAAVRRGGQSVATRRVPVFLKAQSQCLRCGKEILDPLTVEQWERHCSARCYFARELPALSRRAA